MRVLIFTAPLGRCLLATLLALAGWALAPGAVLAQNTLAQDADVAVDEEEAQLPIYERRPFDELHLTDDSVVLIKPLPLPGRKLPEKPRPAEKLFITKIDEPDVQYTVQWKDIAKIRLFEHIVLQEAEDQVRNRRFNEAFPYYQHLRRFYPKLEGLQESIQAYLLAEARSWREKQQHDRALALLNELYVQNREHDQLVSAMSASTSALVQHYVARNQFRSVRRLVAEMAAKFPKADVVTLWRNRLTDRSRSLLVRAQAEFDKTRFSWSRDLAEHALAIWPTDEARRLLRDIHQQRPLLVVGVTAVAKRFEPGALDDHASARSSRLVYRTLVEYAGPGEAGGSYRCPVGVIQPQDAPRKLTFHLSEGIRWHQLDRPLTGHDVSRRLAALADSKSDVYRPDWAALFGGVAVHGLYDVEITLRRSHVHPAAMLQTILVPWSQPSTASSPAFNGPYALESPPEADNAGEAPPRREHDVRYLASPTYFARGEKQPGEIIERYFSNSRAAEAALRTGEIAVLDRVSPWQVESLSADRRLAVRRYAVPRVHVLLPNQDKPLLANRTFRRALVYGLHRQAILDQLIGDSQPKSTRVVSGPFPAGETLDDPLGYASDQTIDPRPYNPRLALALASLARRELDVLKKKKAAAGATRKDTAEKTDKADETTPANAAKKPGDGGKASSESATPPLILEHPPCDIARIACRSIQQQFKLIGVPVALREQEPGAKPSDDFDLRYVELAMWEPVVDARRLLAPGGLAGGASAYLRQAFRRLEVAEDWRAARNDLHLIHRIAHEEVSIIPLWQLTDYYAFRREVGIPNQRPVSLYQDVEQWQALPFQIVDAP